MKYTVEQQTQAMEQAFKQYNLDCHIVYKERKSEFHTWAEQIAKRFFRKGMPIKNSYMYCNALDMCFFFLKDGTAIYTYAGYADQWDGTEEKIVNAFRIANKVRTAMEEALAKMGGKP